LGYDSSMGRHAIPPNSIPWIWTTAIWLGFGLVDALDTVFVMHAEGMHHAVLIAA
jgi:hypothetical protein